MSFLMAEINTAPKISNAFTANMGQDKTKSKNVSQGDDKLSDYVFDGVRHRMEDQRRKELGKNFVDYDRDAVAANAKKYENVTKDVADMDFQKWLQITIAGFKYQDPMDPKDPGAVTAELAQVGAAVATSKNSKTLEGMHNTMNKSMSLTASQGIGNHIEAEFNTFKHVEGMETQLGFALPRSAEKIQVTILDESGTETHRMTLTNGETVKMNGKDQVIDLSMGRHDIYWHGLKSNGTKAETGQYSFQIRALDKDNKVLKDSDTNRPIEIPKYVQGTLDASYFDQKKGNRLIMDGIDIPFDNLKKFYKNHEFHEKQNETTNHQKQNPLPEHPQPHMVNAANKLWSDDVNDKWAKHQEAFLNKAYKGKSEDDLTQDMLRTLKKYNVDLPNTAKL